MRPAIVAALLTVTVATLSGSAQSLPVPGSSSTPRIDALLNALIENNPSFSTPEQRVEGFDQLIVPYAARMSPVLRSVKPSRWTKLPRLAASDTDVAQERKGLSEAVAAAEVNGTELDRLRDHLQNQRFVHAHCATIATKLDEIRRALDSEPAPSLGIGLQLTFDTFHIPGSDERWRAVDASWQRVETCVESYDFANAKLRSLQEAEVARTRLRAGLIAASFAGLSPLEQFRRALEQARETRETSRGIERLRTATLQLEEASKAGEPRLAEAWTERQRTLAEVVAALGDRLEREREALAAVSVVLGGRRTALTEEEAAIKRLTATHAEARSALATESEGVQRQVADDARTRQALDADATRLNDEEARLEAVRQRFEAVSGCVGDPSACAGDTAWRAALDAQQRAQHTYLREYKALLQARRTLSEARTRQRERELATRAVQSHLRVQRSALLEIVKEIHARRAAHVTALIAWRKAADTHAAQTQSNGDDRTTMLAVQAALVSGPGSCERAHSGAP